MSNAIEIRLEKAANGLIFQVIAQPECIREFGEFRASNGWAVKSISSPDLDFDSKRIFLRGDDPDQDQALQLYTIANTKTRDQIYNAILEAMEEFVNSSMYQELIAIAEQPIVPTTFKFGD